MKPTGATRTNNFSPANQTPLPLGVAPVRLPIHVIAILVGLVVVIIATGYLLSPGLLPTSAWDNPMVPIAIPILATLGAIAAVLRPRWVLYGFVFTAIVFHSILEELYLPLGFMKLYITDSVFAFNISFIGIRFLFGIWPWQKSRINGFVVAYLALGLWGVANGLLLKHNAFDVVFGDFRRAYFYFSNFFVVMLICDSWKEVRTMRNVVLVAGIALTLKAFFQAAFGQFYYRRAGDAAHVLSQYEIIFISIILFYALAHLLYAPTRHRLAWAATAGASIVAIILANYRAGWLGTMAGLGFLFILLPWHRKMRMAMLGILGFLFISTAVLLMWEQKVTAGNSTVGQELLQKANVKQTTTDINVIWRFESYTAALIQWRQHPLLGSGLGTYVDFYAPTSTGGSILAEGHNIHNSMLWLLMTQGLLGFAVIMAMHIVFLRMAIAFLRRTEWTEGRIFVTAATAYYAAMMVATLFENFLEHATPITVFSTMMALTILTIAHEESRRNSPVVVAD